MNVVRFKLKSHCVDKHFGVIDKTRDSKKYGPTWNFFMEKGESYLLKNK